MGIQENPTGQWSRPLRTIHLLLAAAVTAQLLIGSFMRSPETGRADTFGFMSHEVIGAIILALIIVHWLWSVTHPNEGLRHLFPWTRQGLINVANQFWQAVRYQRLPQGGPGKEGGLTGFVHGLGLLAITAMVITGGTYYLSRMMGASHDTLEIIEDVHDTFAVISWIYWGGHLAATVLHSLLRQPVWQRMFSLRS